MLITFPFFSFHVEVKLVFRSVCDASTRRDETKETSEHDATRQDCIIARRFFMLM